jgi:conjugative relaxase-like TrwC/TraI family protein
MLGITVSRVVEAALEYFDRELTGRQEAGYYGCGVWRGELAERLELQGEVRREDFQALLRNERPEGGRLTARKNTTRMQDGKRVSNRQIGYDWTFGAPKSVSIYLEAADEREMEAICHRALNRTLEKIEAHMQCKVRKYAMKTICTSNFQNQGILVTIEAATQKDKNRWKAEAAGIPLADLIRDRLVLWLAIGKTDAN